LEIHDGGKHGYLMFDDKLYLDTLEKTEKFLSSADFLPKH
jgi:hypothetical protein